MAELFILPRSELEAVIEADFVGIPPVALVASIHDLAEHYLAFVDHFDAEVAPLLAQQTDTILRMSAALDQLLKVGDEDWKKPGHPMNAWVSKDSVHRIARMGIGA